MTIDRIPTEDLGEVLLQLVKQGLVFTCVPSRNCAGSWVVTLTGGY